MLKRLANPDVAQAFSNLVWLGLERLTQIGVAIAISGLLARYFGPDAFGKWQYANTLLLVLSPLTWVCGAEILVPTIVQAPPERLGAVLGSAFVLRIAVAVVTVVATWAWIAAGMLDPLVGAMLTGLAVTLVLREPFIATVSSWLQSMTYSKPLLLSSIVTAVAKAVLVWLLVRAAMHPATFSWLWVLESVAISVSLMLYYRRRHGGSLGWRVDWSLLRHFTTAGTVFWLGLICMYLFLKLDRLMLERHVSFADLGLYSAAQQLNENWITLALMLAQTIAPAFVYRVQDIARLRRNVVRLIAMTAALMIAGALVLDALAPLIVGKVFGPGYEASVGIFRWAVWLSVPAGIEAIGNLIVLKYQAKFVLLTKWVLALAIAALVNQLAIPPLGLYGALVGLAAGYLAAAAVNFYYIRLKLGS
ncbi:oligosaccharide flippase family protein [Burkholderia guangdongensis]|uniref:oligosaccharide flippase family protein n=1 Tax=Burkholderia guangdongensis TaxID=1792500 RepID=UPI0015CDF652|nr:oligosaccharide flippase family protein [Burkholderia guangdongensis]